MAFSAFRGMGAVSEFFMALFMILVLFLVTMFIAAVAAIPLFGGSLFWEAFRSANLDNPAHIEVLRYFQVMQSVGMFVLPPFAIGWFYCGDSLRYLSMRGPVRWRFMLLGVVALLVVMPFIGLVGHLNQQMSFPEWMAGLEQWMRAMEDQAEVIVQKFIAAKGTGSLLFNLFMIAVIPALGEEFLFRGVIQQIFTKMTRNYHWGIWISAFLFSALHMQFFGFIPRLLLGAMFGYFLVYSGSIWVPVLAHFVNNTIGVLSLYSAKEGTSGLEQIVDPDFSEGIAYFWPLALVSLACTIWLILQMKKKRAAKIAGLD
jgi:membrane protease YdiL (CAAX protease family)